jgi:hypothetical protein
MRLHVEADRLTPEVAARLADLVEAHPGPEELVLVIHNGKSRKVLRLQPQTDACVDFHLEVESLLEFHGLL